MGTVRWRLTVWYAVALFLSLAGFGAAVASELGKPNLDVLDGQLDSERDLAVNYLAESYRVLGSLVVPDATALSAGIAAGLQGFRDYVVVADPSGRELYVSDVATALPFSDLQLLSRPLAERPLQDGVRTIRLSDGRELRARVSALRTAGPEIGGITVAAPVSRAVPELAVFLRAMLVTAPFVLLASVAVGYVLARRALDPVERIIDELEAITDGRSLHRRLVTPSTGDEVARLAQTLNGMLTRLEQSFSSLRRFTADASHELKTPIMVVRAGVERALTHPRTPNEVLAQLDETLEEINRMTELVESLLTLARADEGRAPLAVERTDVRALVEEAAETAGILGEGASVAVSSAIPAEPVWAAVDRRRMRELLLNLVTNAIKYTPAGGRVALSLEQRPEAIQLVVRDTGIGIAAGDLPHVFERFWRADLARSRTGERPGTGLGLAITKWIAEAHGGTISVASRPGRGTSMTVTLPPLGAGLAPDETPAVRSSEDATTSGE
ncbi:MAG TPA: ATP-binding protein [Gemmatimonadales bacterium]|nr:ATP-binding protein [Gemmatimonadales bacterium]